MRIFLDTDTHDVIFSPDTQPVPSVAEDVYHQWDVTEGTIRYDDDPGVNPDSPWQEIAADHADQVISGIYVTVGFSIGTNLTGCREYLASTKRVPVRKLRRLLGFSDRKQDRDQTSAVP